jgi:hypothetical protein
MKIIGYCYHLVDVITFVLAQSDHIKKWLIGTVIGIQSILIIRSFGCTVSTIFRSIDKGETADYSNLKIFVLFAFHHKKLEIGRKNRSFVLN